MKKHYLIIDIGTGNSRVSLVSSMGEIYAIKTIENIYYMDSHHEDAQYFSPSFWKRRILGICKEIIHENPTIKIDAISSSGARETIVLLDKEGNEFFGLPNIDNRAREYMKDICDIDYIYEKTGRWVSEDFPAAKLYGLKKGRNDIFKRVHSFTSLSEWMAYILTGNLVIEPSQACETQLYDITTKDWSTTLCDLYQMRHLELPKLVNGGVNIGSIRDDIKKDLKIDYDIDFIIGGADTQLAAIGAGIKEGGVGIISGTTSPVVALKTDLFYDEEKRCWVDCFVGGKQYQVETNPGVTGLNYQRIRNLLFPEVSYDDIEEGFKEVTDIKCTAFFSSLDFTNGKGYETGGFIMRPPFHFDMHRIDLAWAVVGDIACSIYTQYLHLLDLLQLHPKEVVGCGGGFQSSTLCQHIADLTGKKLCLPKNYQQSSILGCIALCNQAYSIEVEVTSDDYIIYEPRKESLIIKYYEIWKENRKKLDS